MRDAFMLHFPTSKDLDGWYLSHVQLIVTWGLRSNGTLHCNSRGKFLAREIARPSSRRAPEGSANRVPKRRVSVRCQRDLVHVMS